MFFSPPGSRVSQRRPLDAPDHECAGFQYAHERLLQAVFNAPGLQVIPPKARLPCAGGE